MNADIPPRRDPDDPAYESDATRPLTPAERDQAVVDDGNRTVYADDAGRTAYVDDTNRTAAVNGTNRTAAADDVRPVYAADTHTADATDDDRRQRTFRDEVLDREEARFGGMKFGSAFFGWLTAMGLAVLLTALVAAIGGAVGLTSPQTAEDAADAATENLGVATIIGAIVIAIVLFVSYFAGGYVAGRMARFNGFKQGLAVWLWAILIAVIVAIITAIAGTQWDLLANIDTFPRIPVSPDTLTLTGVLTAIGAAIVTLAGALLGGAAGMRYHRRVDRVGLGA